MSHDFKFPDLSPQRGPRGRWLSVHPTKTYVGLSQDLTRTLDMRDGDYLVIAFDDAGRPWIGAHASTGAHIYNLGTDESAKVESKAVQIQLRRFAHEERTRLYLNGDTAEAEVEGETITLYRLTPESEGSNDG